MTLEELAEVSARVAATRSRLAKRDLIAELLRRTPPAELELVTAWLAGTLLQRRTGVGWRGLTDLPPAADHATLSLAEIDGVLSRLGTLHGPGSATARREEVAALFARLTASEQRLLRGLMTGEVRQGAQDAVVLEAIAAAAEVPVAAVRRAAMFSAPTGPVAVAALTVGEQALRRFTLQAGRPVRPMLASSAPDVAAALEKAGGRVAADTKLDGIRIQVHKRADEVQVFTRSLDEIASRLPDVVARTRTLPARDLVLDGEALTVDERGRPRPFQDTASRTASREGTGQVRPFFFDVLLVDDRDLVTEPLAERLAVLDGLVPEGMRVRRLVTDTVAEAARFYEQAVADGQEGVVLKRLDAPYAAGRRGSAWVKVKPRHTLDLVVLAVEWGSGRRQGRLSNIHLGARDPGSGGFTMLGKTFKGMTDEMLAWQTERFLQLETSRERHVVHVRPEQVVEVAFDGLQRSTRYPGGLALRFARVVRYRDDKTVGEADTIEAVRALAGPAAD
ncbi:MAG: ATP-dependent DNA ligase [Marmoricola sp.]